VRSLAVDQRLHDLKAEQAFIEQRIGAVGSVAEQMQLQRRARDLTSEITELEAAMQATAPTPAAAPQPPQSQPAPDPTPQSTSNSEQHPQLEPEVCGTAAQVRIPEVIPELNQKLILNISLLQEAMRENHWQSDEYNKELDGMLVRLRSNRFRIAILGQVVRGKTALINAFLGEAILPVRSVPTTFMVTPITWSDNPRAILYFNEEEPPHEFSLDEIGKYVVADDEDTRFALGRVYNSVGIAYPFSLGNHDIDLIDLPGVNSSDRSVADALMMHYLQYGYVDTIVFVVDCGSGLNSTEHKILSSLVDNMGFKHIFFVCNKVDLIDEQDLQAVKSYFVRHLSQYTELGDDGVFFVSAREALRARQNGDAEHLQDSGVEALERRLKHFVQYDRDVCRLSQMAHRLKFIIGQAYNDIEAIIPRLNRNIEEARERYQEAEEILQRHEMDRHRIEEHEIEGFEHIIGHIRNQVALVRKDYEDTQNETQRTVDNLLGVRRLLEEIGASIDDIITRLSSQ
jgi:GTPase SAR1 family protein